MEIIQYTRNWVKGVAEAHCPGLYEEFLTLSVKYEDSISKTVGEDIIYFEVNFWRIVNKVHMCNSLNVIVCIFGMKK